MTTARILLVLGGLAVVAACVPKRETPPPPPPPPPVTTARPVPPPPPADWRDMPLTPGGWIYRSDGNLSQAMFGPTADEAAFVVRCDRVRRQVVLARQGSGRTPMTVRTSFGARAFPVATDSDPHPYLTASLAASDRFLDTIAFSRGRFTVETPGLPMLVIPAWPEPARVVEDCRG